MKKIERIFSDFPKIDGPVNDVAFP